MKAAAKRKDFKPVPLKAKLDVHGDAKTEVITSHNVVGLLPGTARPDETVIYTAHWDHLGIGQPDANGDRIYNGAIDNGTGLAQLIEQGRAFAAGPRPQRSVVFLAVTAEEKGLLGSEYYAANPLYPAAKTAGVINTDVMGVLGPASDFTIRGNQKFGLLDMLVEEGAKRGRRYTPDPRPETGGFFRSDHFTLAKVGIPAMSFGPGQDLVNGGVARGAGLAGQLHRQDVPPAGRRIFARLGLHRHGPGCRVAARGRPEARQQQRMAQLEPGQRIPRRPRRDGEPARRNRSARRQAPRPLPLHRRQNPASGDERNARAGAPA